MNNHNCYVYVYLNPLKPGKYYYEGSSVAFLYEPFYVGKGTNKRMYQHIKHSTPGTAKYNTIRKIQLNGHNPKDYIIKVAEGISNDDALSIESNLVKIIGRQRTKEGPLVNVAAGGGGSKTVNKKIPHEITEQTKTYIIDNYRLGNSIYAISKNIPHGYFTIRRVLIEAGIQVINNSNVGVGLILSSKCDDIKQMITSGVSVSDIAKMFNTSRQTIYTFMEQNHIPTKLQMKRGEVA